MFFVKSSLLCAKISSITLSLNHRSPALASSLLVAIHLISTPLSTKSLWPGWPTSRCDLNWHRFALFVAGSSVWGSHFTKTVDNYRKSIEGDSHKSTHFRTIRDWLATKGLFNTLSLVMMLENLNNYSQFMVTSPKLTLSSLFFSRRRQNICNQSISLFMFPKWSILQICFCVSFRKALKGVILKHTHTRKEF